VSNSALPNPLSELFESREPEIRLKRVWCGIELRRRRHVAAWPLRGALAAACVSFLLTLGTWFLWSRESHHAKAPAYATVEAIVESGKVPRELDFGDGARITVGPATRLDVLEQAAHNVTLALRQGLAQFDIRPGGARHWQIESAGVTVEVVGTQFSVERSPNTVRVEVQRGRVLVRGAAVPDQVQALDAGRVLIVDTAREGQLVSKARAEPSASQVQPATSALSPSRPPMRGTASNQLVTAQSWRQAAFAQEWQLAWDTLGPDGVVQQSRQTESVTDLFALADVARRSGHPEASVGPLQILVESHAQDPRASVAAFTLGRVWLDALGRPSEAVTAFQRALALDLPVTLAEDAQARLVEALAKSGAPAQSRAAAELYRSRYPNGTRRADVDRWSPQK